MEYSSLINNYKILIIKHNNSLLKLTKMKFMKRLGKMIQKCDFFSTTEFLRYQTEAEYESVLGGILSMVILISLFIAFSSRLIDTLNMLSITSSTSSSDADDPTPFTVTTKGEDRRPFMFGVQIWHHNLNEGPRLFDINLVNQNYNYGASTDKSINYLLEPCTVDHWRGYPQIQKKFYQISINYWLCLPKDIDYPINGKYASPVQNTIQVSVNKCSNTSLDTRPCADDATINAYFQSLQQKVYFTIYFINPLLNPDQADFLTYYLQDSNYIIFSQTGGEEGQLLLQDFTVTTDNSIFPFSDYSDVSGGLISGSAIKNRFQVSSDNTNYCTFYIFKSPISLKITRGYEKIDNILSYIGGLFGTVIALLFIMRVYNNYSFEIDVASLLYKCDEDKFNFKKYNILYFFLHLFYRIFRSKLSDSQSWKTIKGYYKTRRQLLKQLDVFYLLKRVNFLQKSIEIIFQQHQLKGVHLLKQTSLLDAKKQRKRFKLHQKAISDFLKLDDKKDNNVSSTLQLNLNDKNVQKKNPNQNSYSASLNQNIQGGKNTQSKILKQNQPYEQKQESQSSDSDSEAQIESNDNTTVHLLLLKNQKHKSKISKRIYQNLDQNLRKQIERHKDDTILINPNQNKVKDITINNVDSVELRSRKRYQLPNLRHSYNQIHNEQIEIYHDVQNIQEHRFDEKRQ